jgi:hypothetical protein
MKTCKIEILFVLFYYNIIQYNKTIIYIKMQHDAIAEPSNYAPLLLQPKPSHAIDITGQINQMCKGQDYIVGDKTIDQTIAQFLCHWLVGQCPLRTHPWKK